MGINVKKKTLLVVGGDDVAAEFTIGPSERWQLIPDIVELSITEDGSFSVGTPNVEERVILALIMLGQKPAAIKFWRESRRRDRSEAWGLLEARKLMDELEMNVITAIELSKSVARHRVDPTYEEPPMVIRTDVNFADEGLGVSGDDDIKMQQQVDEIVNSLSGRPKPQ